MNFSRRIIPFTLVLTILSPAFYQHQALAAETSATPDWLNKGSGFYKGERGRVVWGVGVASWTTEKSLLKMQADNAALESVANTFGTLITSILDRYMDSISSGEQTSEKTKLQSLEHSYVEQALIGAVIIDRYLAADGTMYSLAELNVDNIDNMQAVMEKELAGFSEHDINQDYNELAIALKPVSAIPNSQSATSTSSGAVAHNDKKATTSRHKKPKKVKVRKSRKAPDWLNDESAEFPNSQYLCGVGSGKDRETAENTSLEAISRVFSAKVVGEGRTYMASLQRSGQANVEINNLEHQTKVTTENVLRGVQLREIYKERRGDTYALSCLERAPVALELRQLIKQLDDKAAKDLAHAEEGSRLTRIKQLTQCADTLLERSLLNSQLRIVDADGIGMAPALSYADIAEALEKAREKLNIVISITGDDSDSVKAAIIQAFNKNDFQILDQQSLPADQAATTKIHLLVKASLRLEDVGMGGPNGVYYMQRAVMPVTIENGETGKAIISFEISDKQGMNSVEEAQRKVLRELAKKVSKRLDKEITRYIEQ